MVTAAATIQQMGSRSGKIYYIANSYITALTSTTFTAPFFFASVADSTNSFLGWGVWRPTATAAADYFRHISSVNVTTGVVTIDVAWATDTTLGTEDIYLLAPGITPIHVINALNAALDKAHFINTEPLSSKPAGAVIADAGLQNSATSSYTTSNTTFTKVTTDNSENVYDGIGSGKLVNTSASGHIYQDFNVTGGESVNVFALSRLDVGTNAQLVIEAGASTASLTALGSTVSHSQEAWQWMVRRGEAVPSTAKILRAKLQGAGASDESYWNALCVYSTHEHRLILDTKWDSNFKAMKLLYADIGGVSVGTGIYQASATQIKEVPHDDYQFVFQRTSAHPGYVQFRNNKWLNYPLLVFGRRPYSAVTTIAITDLTTTCDIDVDLWDGMARQELFSMGDISRKVIDARTEAAKGAADAARADSETAYDAAAPAPTHSFSSWGRV